MNRPRWKKLMRDLALARGRMVMLVVAIAASIFGVGLMLTTYTIATREMTANYLGTHPASAFIELDKVDDSLVNEVRQRPNIADAEATSWVTARVEVEPDKWMPLLLFIMPDFAVSRISTVSPQAGAFPPPNNTILVEREVLPMLKLSIGDNLTVQTPHGNKQSILISGTVHDPSLAPAWQEQTVYGYITPATLAALGEDETLHILKITVRDQSANINAIEMTIGELSGWLTAQGHMVEEIRIPPPLQHPHQGQMNAVMMVLLSFSILALILSAVLTATMIGGLLAQQTRQIGIMKAIGARSSQISTMYLLLVMGLGLAAVIIGTPLGIFAGRGFAEAVAHLLNLNIRNSDLPVWVYGVLLLMGIFLPVIVAVGPIRRTTRITVRETLADYGASSAAFGTRRLDNWLRKLQGINNALLMAFRNMFRRRSRLVLSLGLLGAAGAMFMTGLNVSSGWENYIRMAATDRHYDLEVRFNNPESESRVTEVLTAIPGVEKVENWSLVPAAVARLNGLNIVRTYPDGGHGSFSLRAAPPDSGFINTTVLSGRWLQSGDTNGVVVNQNAVALLPNATVGGDVNLLIEGRLVKLRVVGVIRQILSPAAAYVIPQTFNAAVGQSIDTTRAVRVAMHLRDLESVEQVTQNIESALAAEHISVSTAISETLLDNAISGHVYVFIVALILIAAVMAVVGMLGLASNMSISVIERTREFGIMRAVGAQSRTVLQNVISEGIFTALLSWFIAMSLSIPLSLGLGAYLGTMAFRSPLPLTVSPVGLGIWILVLLIGSVAASVFPAQQAAKLTIRETLAYV